MGQPPERFTPGWYDYDRTTGRLFLVQPDPTIRRTRWFLRAAILAAIGNAIAFPIAFGGGWRVGIIFAFWPFGAICLAPDNWPTYEHPWRIWLAVGTLSNLALLAGEGWTVATGMPLTLPVIAAGACQATVAVLTGSVLARTSRPR